MTSKIEQFNISAYLIFLLSSSVNGIKQFQPFIIHLFKSAFINSLWKEHLLHKKAAELLVLGNMKKFTHKDSHDLFNNRCVRVSFACQFSVDEFQLFFAEGIEDFRFSLEIRVDRTFANSSFSGQLLN